jgi:hypothetical protein
LGTVVLGGRRPTGRLARSFHGIADVFAVADADVADNLTLGRDDLAGIVAVRARLFAADVELGGAVDGWQIKPATVWLGFG